jgi:hypothetical protein
MHFDDCFVECQNANDIERRRRELDTIIYHTQSLSIDNLEEIIKENLSLKAALIRSEQRLRHLQLSSIRLENNNGLYVTNVPITIDNGVQTDDDHHSISTAIQHYSDINRCRMILKEMRTNQVKTNTFSNKNIID